MKTKNKIPTVQNILIWVLACTICIVCCYSIFKAGYNKGVKEGFELGSYNQAKYYECYGKYMNCNYRELVLEEWIKNKWTPQNNEDIKNLQEK